MLKTITKKVISCVVIFSLVFSLLSFATYSESSEPPAKVSQIKKVITAALAVDDKEKRKEAADLLDDVDTMDVIQIQENIKNIIGVTLTEHDITVLKGEFSKFTFIQRGVISSLIKQGYTNDSDDFSSFRTIANRINRIVTNDESNDNGTRFFITILEQLAVTYSLPTVYDYNGDKSQIYFAMLDAGKKEKVNSFLSGLLPFVEEREDGLNKGTVEDFLIKAHNILNGLNVGEEIKAFKAFLENENGLIYNEKAIVPGYTPTPTVAPSPSSSTGGGTGGGGVVIVATPTPTSTVAATATATSTPTIRPTVTPTAVIGPTDKQITAFSFKNLPDAKAVIFEKVHTIVIKLPEGTDLTNLEPVIEFKGASISPDPSAKKNFNNPVFYTVTAPDKSKVKYVVMVELVNPNDMDKVVIEPKEIIPGYGPFGDIFGHWAEDRIISLIEKGAIAGYPDGSVKPDIDMTRAEVITALVKAIGLEPVKEPNLKFADVKSIPEWAQGYIQVAVDNGIIQGYPDNTYKANNKVTRSEFLVMAMKAYKYEESNNTSLKFKDAKDIPSWALGYLAKAVETTIIEGYTDNTVKPNNRITRAEVMTIIDKCMTLGAEK